MLLSLYKPWEASENTKPSGDPFDKFDHIFFLQLPNEKKKKQFYIANCSVVLDFVCTSYKFKKKCCQDVFELKSNFTNERKEIFFPVSQKVVFLIMYFT